MLCGPSGKLILWVAGIAHDSCLTLKVIFTL